MSEARKDLRQICPCDISSRKTWRSGDSADPRTQDTVAARREPAHDVLETLALLGWIAWLNVPSFTSIVAKGRRCLARIPADGDAALSRLLPAA